MDIQPFYVMLRICVENLRCCHPIFGLPSYENGVSKLFSPVN